MRKNKPGLREILTSAVFIAVIGALFILNLIVPAPAVLKSERRAPAKFPEFSINSVLSASFMEKFEDYAADRFVFRDAFRAVSAFAVFDLLLQSDKSGVYRSKNVGAGELQRVSVSAFRQTAEKIRETAQSLDGLGMNIYYSIVPDKSIFAEKYLPGFDLAVAEDVLLDALDDYAYIRLADSLGAECFYKTDLHWNQAKITDVAKCMLLAMGAVPDLDGYREVTAGEFRGVYAGQLALPIDADILTYLDIPGLTVSYLSEKTLQFEEGPVYDSGRFGGIDPYDIFLRGPQPLIVIENESAPAERELYLFRDSFGSSLAPLLAGSYSKITLIDLRYVNMSVLDQFMEFQPGADVLFVYSSQIFNNPSVLQT